MKSSISIYHSKMVGLDPIETNFGDLAPYFEQDIDNEDVKKGMICMYDDLLKSHTNSISILLLCLMSIAYHIGFIRDVIDRNSGHLFLSLPILQHQEFLEKLSEIITRKP